MGLDNAVVLRNGEQNLTDAVADVIANNIAYKQVAEKDANKRKGKINQVEACPVNAT